MKIELEKFFSIELLKEFYNKDNLLSDSFINVVDNRFKDEFLFERNFLALFYFLITENKRVTNLKETDNLVDFSSLLFIFKYHLTLDNSNMKEKKNKVLFAQSDILVLDILKKKYDTFPLNFFYEFIDTFGMSLELSLSGKSSLEGNKYLEPYFLLLFKSLYYFDSNREMQELINYANFVKQLYILLMQRKKLYLNLPKISDDLANSVQIKGSLDYLEGIYGKY